MITEEMARACVPSRGLVHSWVSYGYNATDCNLAYHILGGLLLLSQTLPPHLNISLGAPTYGNLFGMVVGESTESRKTTSLKLVRQMIDHVYGNFTPVTVGPGSDAGLVDHLVRSPRCLIMYEEFGDFLKATEAGPLTSMKTKYTELYDAGRVGRLLSSKRDRNGALVNDQRVVENPRLSIAGAVNQSFLEDFTQPGDWTGGFLARFLTLFAHRERNYDIPEVPRAWHEVVAGQMREMLDLGLVVGACDGLDDDAKKIWHEWNAQLRTMRTQNRLHRHAEASVSRSPAMALKIALLLMWDIGGIRNLRDQPWRVNAETMWFGCAITNLHIRSVLTLLPTLAGSKDQRECREILRVVGESNDPLTLGQILERTRLIKRRCQELIESLCESGQLQRVLKAGRAGTRYGKGGGADELAGADLALPAAASDNVIPFPAPPAQPVLSQAQPFEGQTNSDGDDPF